MNNTRTHIVFMSCKIQDEKDLERCLYANGLRFTTGLGCYEGIREKSYLILLSTDIRLAEQRLNVVLGLGSMFEQESVLYCDNERTGYLIYCNDPKHEEHKLGTLSTVALPLGDYSFFNDIYYEVR